MSRKKSKISEYHETNCFNVNRISVNKTNRNPNIGQELEFRNIGMKYRKSIPNTIHLLNNVHNSTSHKSQNTI